MSLFSRMGIRDGIDLDFLCTVLVLSAIFCAWVSILSGSLFVFSFLVFEVWWPGWAFLQFRPPPQKKKKQKKKKLWNSGDVVVGQVVCNQKMGSGDRAMRRVLKTNQHGTHFLSASEISFWSWTCTSFYFSAFMKRGRAAMNGCSCESYSFVLRLWWPVIWTWLARNSLFHINCLRGQTSLIISLQRGLSLPPTSSAFTLKGFSLPFSLRSLSSSFSVSLSFFSSQNSWLWIYPLL